MSKRLWMVGSALLTFAMFAAPELRDGDRVALVGNTFFEREADASYIETALLLSHAELPLTFRNFGWSGDTPTGAARGYFKPNEGYGLLLEQVSKVKPTLILLNYGANVAWEGEAGLEKFRTDLSKLIDDLAKKTEARFVLCSPLAQEAFPAPFPNPEAHNAELARYSAAIKAIAAEKNAEFIDLFQNLRGERLTSNSIHLNTAGYRKAAEVMVQAFGKTMPDLDKAETLRQTVIAKNEQFFNQWRPQNTTYLFGFRKHEQGNNAVETEQIDPFLTKLDAQIHDLAMGKPAGEAVIKPGVGFNPQGNKYVASPELEVQTLQVPADLSVSLFASEPMVVNPTCMNWDQAGRLWVACAPLYPHVKPGHRATDRIIMLEDTDKDGKADKRVVFAEGLLIPTAVLPGNGGVYVGNSTELIHLKDTDGDGKADEETVVLSGFGTEDTHHILHTPRWGQDGLMYFNQSIYIHSHIETPWGVSRLMAGGIWKFDPLSVKLEVVSRGLVNTWGHSMDDWGQSFATDGAGGHGINYIFPGVAAVTAYGTKHLLPGMNPGQPKLCGLETVSGTHFPEKYRGLLVANDFRGHRTNSYRLSEDGSAYRSTQDVDFVGTAHRGTDRLGKGGGFRPVDLKMGPDGALYVADWSNIIIQHGEVDFRDDRRDHEHGRIWRIAAKDRAPVHAPKIVAAPVAELIKNLESSERWTVEASKRELIERGDSVLPAVEKWGLAQSESLALHALWLHVGLGKPNETLLARSLAAKDGRVRAAAIRTLRHWRDTAANVDARLAKAIADEHPRVRLEALHGLRAQDSLAAAESAIRVLDKPMDKVLDYAFVLTMRDLQPRWSGETTFGGNLKYLTRAIEATGDDKALDPLFVAFREGTIPAENREEVLALIARKGNAKQMLSVLEVALKEDLPTAARVKLMRAVGDGAEKRKLRLGDLKVLLPLVDSKDAALANSAVRLMGQLKFGGGIGKLQEAALNPAHPQGAAAIAALSKMGGGGVVKALQKILTESKQPGRKVSALAALAGVDVKAAANSAEAVFQALPEAANSAAIFDAFYRQKQGPQLLSKALIAKTIPAYVARIGVRQATTCGRDLANHIKVLSTAGGLEPMKQTLSAEEMAAIVAKVGAEGKAEVGERIYRRLELACVACHAIGGIGPEMGPDLISIGASAPVDYLIESLLNPNAKIKEGYHMTVATMKNGQSIAGSQVSDSGGELVIRDPAGVVHTLARKQVAKKVVSPTSMMPPGLTASLQPEEFVHLVAFLSRLGKDEAFRAPGPKTLRSFQVIVKTPDLEKKLGAHKTRWHQVAAKPEKVSWQPATSLVSGAIPLDASTFQEAPSAIRFSIESAAKGAVTLQASSSAQIWMNGERLDVRNGKVTFEQKKGVHDMLLFPHGNPATLKVQLIDASKSQANAIFKIN